MKPILVSVVFDKDWSREYRAVDYDVGYFDITYTDDGIYIDGIKDVKATYTNVTSAARKRVAHIRTFIFVEIDYKDDE